MRSLGAADVAWWNGEMSMYCVTVYAFDGNSSVCTQFQGQFNDARFDDSYFIQGQSKFGYISTGFCSLAATFAWTTATPVGPRPAAMCAFSFIGSSAQLTCGEGGGVITVRSCGKYQLSRAWAV